MPKLSFYPDLTIEARLGRGVRRVKVHMDRDASADAGLALLRRVLPILADLDREVRK